jgi:hypothetical protein
VHGIKRFRDNIFQHPTVLPLIIIIFQELCFWKIIDVGDSCTLFLALIATIVMVIYFIGKFDRRKWTAPLFGLAIWDILRLADKRSIYPFLLIGLYGLTIVSLALLLKKKVKIVDYQGVLWIFIVVFLVSIIGMYRVENPIYYNLMHALDDFETWFIIITPGIIFDLLFHQEFHWHRGLFCFSWVPIAMISSPIVNFSHRFEPPFQFVSFLFWTITAFVFFLLIPILQNDSWGTKTRDIVTIIIAVVTIAIVSGGRWMILDDPEILLTPAWFLLIEDSVRFGAPIVLLFLNYRKISKPVQS